MTARTISRCIIVGGGQAGITAASTLRDRGYDGELVVFSEEAHLPYKRPPLSKALLSPETALDTLLGDCVIKA